ncbi:EXLDI protein [Calidithermus terrae]|uniref:EXLDI protein n=2 Tax=Bacteria TaxID=2 RepID=A0A399ECB2_9DEIN|nr:EXLDI protein [Calidithermus terrae]RIH81578.1 EXLDI protein [Calidithermus terrae]
MPNKTIYVSEADLPVFERAQELAGGNLSSTIANALRRFVQEHEPDERGFRDVEVKVGKIAHVQKRFKGRLLVKGRLSERRAPLKEYEVYETAKGRVAVYTCQTYHGELGHLIQDCRLEVYESIEDLVGQVPEELYLAARQMLSGNPVEELDI